MSANQRYRQKNVEKHKRKREQARSNARGPALPTTTRALVRLAATRPFGPAWISERIGDTESQPPALIVLAVTRPLPGGVLLPHVMTVDRTCLGVKDAAVLEPMDDLTLERYVLATAPAGSRLVLCDVDLARSVIFHALDYARSLGFAPHADFSAALMAPRPEQLRDTPHCKPVRSRYFAGPRDEIDRVVGQLRRAVGPDGFQHVSPLRTVMNEIVGEIDAVDDDPGEQAPVEDVLLEGP